MEKCFFLKMLSTHGKNLCFRHLGMKSWYWEDRYAIIFHRRDWPERPHGIDFFEKCSISKNRNPENCPKMFRNGSRKMIWGSREVRKGQNCAPDAMEALPDPKNPFKISKKAKKPLKSGKSKIFRIFLFSRCGQLYITPDQPPWRPLFYWHFYREF